jgi:hypothetical protein
VIFTVGTEVLDTTDSVPSLHFVNALSQDHPTETGGRLLLIVFAEYLLHAFS